MRRVSTARVRPTVASDIYTVGPVLEISGAW
ncbi:Uncharacterised protein [Mycobacteroides abscessus subsp. abscessus]|nr:Uncharacterised protein [Mycobacteroides abscessus subsp. abscessus]